MQQLTEGFRQQFSDNVNRILQQEGSSLRPYVRNETLDHEIEYFETIMSTEAHTRAKDPADGYNIADAVVALNPTIKRRMIAAQQVAWQMGFDSGDRLNTLIEPTSFQNKDAAWALGRQYDRVILDSFASVVRAGQTGQLKVKFPLSTHVVPMGVKLVAQTQGLSAHGDDDIYGDAPDNERIVAGGLTLAKLLKAREILRRSTYNAREKMYFVCSSAQISNLLNDTRIGSFDFNNVKALAAGEVSSFAGFTFITNEMLGGIKPNAAGIAAGNFSIRDCYAFTESSILFGRVKGAYKTKIEERATNYLATYVHVQDSIGAVRMNEKGVAIVKCLERYDDTHEHFIESGAAWGGHAASAPFYISVVPSKLCGFAAANVANNDDLGIADAADANVNRVLAAIARKKLIA